MRLSLRAKGVTLAERDLDGPLLMPPVGTAVATRSALATVLDVIDDGGDTPDLLVGALPLVWWKRSSRSVEVAFLEVPAPPPFIYGDVAAMWERLLASSMPAVESVSLQARAPGRGRMDGNRLRPEAIPPAYAACRRMLGNWPEVETVATIWRPADMRGGREDLVETDRRAGSKPGIVTPRGMSIPDRVARRQRSSATWNSGRLAAACRSLVDAMNNPPPSWESPVVLARPIALVGERAAGQRSAVDPPVSSWPPIAQAALAAVLDARIALALAGEGSDHVPLSHIWRLYENWLVTAVVDALVPLLGPGREITEGSGWGWQWSDGPVLVRVHAQATIGAEPDTDLCGHPDGLVSVLSDLRPDVLVSVCERDGGQAILCVDAKRRIAATKMDASEVAGAASKYVWGIRSGTDPDTPIASTIIASSAPIPDMHDLHEARISTCFLLPSTGGEEFAALVTGRVAALIAGVRPG